jgi:hypothetical protein
MNVCYDLSVLSTKIILSGSGIGFYEAEAIIFRAAELRQLT